MFEETELSDDDLRAALFDALVERLEAKAREEPSIAVVNQMPTVLAVSRLGNLLTLSQGIGAVLLRGNLERHDHEKLRTFDVARASIQSRLTITPDRVEGTPDEILDWIVAKFLEWTAAEEEVPPPAPRASRKTQSPPRPARQESRSAARTPQTPAKIREAVPQERAAPAGPAQEPPPAAPRTMPESRPAPVEVAKETPPRPQANKPREAEAAPPRPAPSPETTTQALRTYQLLLDTAQRELHRAQALSTGSRYFLISAGVLVALAAEAFFNDLGSRAMPSWPRLQRLDPLEKAEVLNAEVFNDRADWSVRPFQSVVAAFGFRDALAHAHAETLSINRLGSAADRGETDLPRTRPIAWEEHCHIATIQQWIMDVRVLIELLSKAHDRA